MDNNQLYLFKDKRFLPLFITQFLGAFNDNVVKNALIILITFKTVKLFGLPSSLLVIVASGIFIIPFLLFAGISGQLADKYEKARLVQIIKLFEIGIVTCSFYGFYLENLKILFFSLFLMGVHSTFFGPLKYSVLPDHLKKDELVSANAYFEAGTFLSILFGTIIGGLFNDFTFYIVMAVMMLAAIIGFISSLFIPKSNNTSPDIKINWNLIQESYNIVQYSLSKRQVFLSILGISWFWFIGAIYLSQIPAFAKDIFKADQTVVTLFLSIFSIGVGVGSVACNTLFAKEISTKYVFLAAIGISVFGIDLFYASQYQNPFFHNGDLIDFKGFLSVARSWRICIDLFLISALGGVYIVPLYAVMQYFSNSNFRSRVIAANNIINSFFMIASTLFVGVLINLNFSVPWVILTLSAINLLVAAYTYKLTPDATIIPRPLLRTILKFILDRTYRVEVKNIENFHKAGKRSVIIANHISYLDPALLAVYLPEDLTFAINTEIAKKWWVKPFLTVVKAYAVDPHNSMSTKGLIKELKDDKKIAIFPEGRLSVTGALMKIYEGPGMIADKADATIIPIRVDGPQYTIFSKTRQIVNKRFFPKFTVTVLPPVKFESTPEFDARARRKYISLKLYDIMTEMMFESSDYKQTLFQSLIDAAKTTGFKHEMSSDFENNNLTYRQFIARSFILHNALKDITKPGEYVGLMLPNMSSSAVVFFGLQAGNRVPTMLNYTLGISSIISICRTAKLKTILTSRRFIKKAELENVAEALDAEFNLVYLEDIGKNIKLTDKLFGLAMSYFPQTYYNNLITSTENDPAVILFTSGTEGFAKAVVLSHTNLHANVWQVASRIDVTKRDIMFNALPMFHCYGLTGGTLLPIILGLKTFFYPSPLHYRIVPEMVYDVGATIMLGTDTFLAGYAKFAHPYDFYSVRYVLAGAEKLREETRKLWSDKYGVRILEGYGATETAPVVAVNTAMHNKSGTVGRLLPAVKYHIEPVEGIDEGGRLCVKGPNIMLGYIFAENPGLLVPPTHPNLGKNWYDTGDIVTIDDEGFITIQGRAKRFAKIAGEMVSLTNVEKLASNAYPQGTHAAMHVADKSKGEKILLFTTNKNVEKSELIKSVKEMGISELHLPKQIIYLDPIPVLSTGKTDYRSLLTEAAKYES